MTLEELKKRNEELDAIISVAGAYLTAGKLDLAASVLELAHKSQPKPESEKPEGEKL